MAQKRKSPGGGTGALPKHRSNGYHHNSGDYRHQAPTLAERREAQLLEELRDLGYCIAVSCAICGHALTSPRSVALMVGPTCRAKAVAE
jgi:hypothetical protein